MAVKARTLLYKASPLFGEPSTEKWQEAAKASKDIIDLGVYSLPTVSSSEEYAALFYNTQNPEIIFEKLYNNKGTYGSALHYCSSLLMALTMAIMVGEYGCLLMIL